LVFDVGGDGGGAVLCEGGVADAGVGG